MKKKLLVLLIIYQLPLLAGLNNLTLNQALKLLDKNNLEIKIAQYNAQMKRYDQFAAEGYDYGKLDFSFMAIRSNDAGNVFGFKLQSREATFGDFGFSEFLGPLGQVLEGANQNALPLGFSQGMGSLLTVQPKDLNYPVARNHFVAKFTYTLPIYTGGKLTEYKKITKSLFEMSKLDMKKVRALKRYEVKKAFYDIALVQDYVHNLRKIINNIARLKQIITEMKKEGYAQETDKLEVRARMAEAESMLSQAKLNKELAYQFLSFLLNTEVSSAKTTKALATSPRVTKAMIERRSIDIQKARLGLKITAMALELEKAKFRPTIGAFAEYGSADNKPLNNFFDKDAYTVGMKLQYNMFSGGADEANLEKARVNMLMVADQVRLAKKGIALKVKHLQTQIGGYDADIKSYRAQLKSARTIYRTYQEKYKEGIASIGDVLIRQAKELEVLLKLLTAKNSRNGKVFELQSLLNLGVK
ncbi:MAG: TolC family protein [Sulfurovum sp.]|nr:TolC family protein [Sulfurovum sp.]